MQKKTIIESPHRGWPVMESNQTYFIRRAEQESSAASRAADPKVRQAHLDMARRYRDLACQTEIAGAPPAGA